MPSALLQKRQSSSRYWSAWYWIENVSGFAVKRRIHVAASCTTAGSALLTFPVSLLPQQPVLALHRAIAPATSRLAPVAVSDLVGHGQISDPVVEDGRPWQRQPLGDLVKREPAIDPHRAGLLAQVLRMGHEHMFPFAWEGTLGREPNSEDSPAIARC